jgi:hypothetical protein
MENGDVEWNLNGLKSDTAAVKRTTNTSTNFRVKKRYVFHFTFSLKENWTPESRNTHEISEK